MSEHQFIPDTEDPKYIKHAPGGDAFNYDELALRVMEEMNKHPQELTPLARAATDSRAQLSKTIEEINAVMDAFRLNLGEWLREARAQRMSFVSEMNAIIVPLRDVRQFFLESDYESEVARLREFVELCERLQKLKESGFLDAVADTLTQLSK